MKRSISMILTLLLVCSLFTGCFKSDEAKAVDEMIEAIGEVSLSSGKALEDARSAAEALEEEHYKQLDNLKLLDEKYDAYYGLQAKEIENKINALGEITLDNRNAVETVHNTYNNAKEAVKEKVTNYDVLEAAVKKISELKVAEVKKLINDIGTVTLNSESKINAADAAYKKLNSTEQKLADPDNKIGAAKTKLQTLKKEQEAARKKTLLSQMRSESDAVRGIKFYEHKTMPNYTDVRCFALPYIGVNNGGEYANKWMYWRFNYTGDDWIFFKSVIINIDGKNTTYTFKYFDIEHDNDYGDVWEWIDKEVGSSEVEVLEKIANSKKTIIRFQGDSYHKDITVSSADKTAIKQVLELYEML